MKGLQFASERIAQPESINRVDIACFIGFINFRDNLLPQSIAQWLKRQGWLSHDLSSPSPYARADEGELYDVPIPIDSWDTFDKLFAWESRPVGESSNAVTYLGAAVNEFFSQGGRKCYVISVGESFDYNLSEEQRLQELPKLIPGYPGLINASKVDRLSWRGVGHIFGLPDIAFLSLPDLSDIFKTEMDPLDIDVPAIPTPPEQFVECSNDNITALVEENNSLANIRAPHLSEDQLNQWRDTINQISSFVGDVKREVQFVSSLPLVAEESLAHKDLLAFCFREAWLQSPISSLNTDSLATAFLQISWPWLRTSLSQGLPQLLVPGEGSLVGLLARNALQRGTYRSVAGQALTNVHDIWPKLSQAQMGEIRTELKGPSNDNYAEALDERFSLWKRSPKGIVLHSDVTTSPSSLYRNANVNRTFAMILRSTRHLGEEFIFETNGETLWRKITDRLNNLLRLLFRLGALDGKSESEAFGVQCDRSTMTRNDIDSGRVIAKISVNIAASIETMIVSFSLQESSDTRLNSIGLKASGLGA